MPDQELSYLERLKLAAMRALGQSTTPPSASNYNHPEPTHRDLGDYEYQTPPERYGPYGQHTEDVEHPNVGDREQNIAYGVPGVLGLPPPLSSDETFVRPGTGAVSVPDYSHGAPSPVKKDKSLYGNSASSSTYYDPFPGATKWSQQAGENLKTAGGGVRKLANTTSGVTFPSVSEEGQRAGRAIVNLQNKLSNPEPSGSIVVDHAIQVGRTSANDRLRELGGYDTATGEQKGLGKAVQGKLNKVYAKAMAEPPVDEQAAKLQSMRAAIDNIKLAQQQDEINRQRKRVQELTAGN